MTRSFSCHLLDMLAEVPGSTQEKRMPPSISLNARTHGCWTPMWATQLYSDCQMGTPPPRPATCLGVHCQTNPGSFNRFIISISVSTSPS